MSTEAAAQTKATKPSGKDLKDTIKRQVEFYFSRANLANDAFLVSQMNSQMYVPVDTIVGFGKIKQLTSNPALVVEAIQDSKVVVLNEAKDAIKPNIKSERNTIILREIPSATEPAAVEAIFEGCGDVTVRSDVGDTWFVTLASEDAAVKTLLELRNKTFNDAPIKARLKSENVLKSFFPAQTLLEPVATNVGGAYSRGYYAAAGSANGYYDMAANYGPQYAAGGGPRGQYSNGTPRQGGRGQQNRQNGGGRGSGNANANGSAAQGKETRAKSNSFDQQQARPASRKAKDKKNKTSDKQVATAAATTTGGAKKGAAATAATSAERQPVLNSANFPPLPVSDKPAGSPYGEIKHTYAHEDILEIVKHMDDDDCKLRAGKMDFEAHGVALTPVAHPDLLRNQRTYSIEQAREALRQGRPIRSDSIGSIDYESMMYGEDYTKEARELRKQKAEAAAADGKADVPAVAAATTGVAAAVAPAQPKVVGYAAALIYGTPAPQPVVEAKKKAPATAAAAPAAAATGAAAGSKAKTPKAAKGDEKKAPKKKEQAPVVDETLPKAGAWGGRAFAEVVKSEPVNPPAAPAKAVAPGAATASPTATTKTPERKDSGKWERNQKDRRPTGGDKQ